MLGLVLERAVARFGVGRSVVLAVTAAVLAVADGINRDERAAHLTLSPVKGAALLCAVLLRGRHCVTRRGCHQKEGRCPHHRDEYVAQFLLHGVAPFGIGSVLRPNREGGRPPSATFCLPPSLALPFLRGSRWAVPFSLGVHVDHGPIAPRGRLVRPSYGVPVVAEQPPVWCGRPVTMRRCAARDTRSRVRVSGWTGISAPRTRIDPPAGEFSRRGTAGPRVASSYRRVRSRGVRVIGRPGGASR